MSFVGRQAALVLIALAGTGGTGSILAQNPPANPPPGNAVRPYPGGGAGQPFQQQRRMQLRMQIEQRFAQRVQSELGLTDEQMSRLRETERSSRDRRQQLNEREQALRQAVAEQLRPGVGANSDSLSRLLADLAANHVARAQDEQQELRDLSQFLSPVQAARLLIMRQQLMQRVQAIREGRFRPGQTMPINPDQPEAPDPEPAGQGPLLMPI